MICKFLKSNQSRGANAVEYCLDKKRHEGGEPRVLKGDENATRLIIQNCPYKNKATFGVLSFSESADSISDKKKLDIIADFERNFIGDFMRERVNILWIEHSDKGRLELNFIIPNIDLISGKNYAPYSHERDKKRKELWQETINTENGFTSPRDPANTQTIECAKKGRLSEKYESLEQLDKELNELVKQGTLTSRAEIIQALQSINCEITRQGADYIGVKLPSQKKATRLKGGIYSENFRELGNIETISAEHSERAREWNKRDTREISAKNRATLAKYREFINGKNRARFEPKKQRADESGKEFKRDNTAEQNGLENTTKSNRGNQENNKNGNARNDEPILNHDKSNAERNFTPNRADETRKYKNNGGHENELNLQPSFVSQQSRALQPTSSFYFWSISPIQHSRNNIIFSKIKTEINQNDSIRESIIRRIREQEQHNRELEKRDRDRAERKRKADERARKLRERETAERERIRAGLERIRNQLKNGIIERVTDNIRKGLRDHKERVKAGIKQFSDKIKTRLREFAQARDEFITKARENRAERERQNSENGGAISTATNAIQLTRARISEHKGAITTSTNGIKSTSESIRTTSTGITTTSTKNRERFTGISQTIKRELAGTSTELTQQLERGKREIAISNQQQHYQERIHAIKPELERAVKLSLERQRQIIRPR